MGDAKRIYIVTLSKELSGSYNSAQLAKQLFEEEYGEGTKQIYIFNSRSASVGETLIGMKVQECETAGMSFEETVEQTEAYIAGQNTRQCGMGRSPQGHRARRQSSHHLRS